MKYLAMIESLRYKTILLLVIWLSTGCYVHAGIKSPLPGAVKDQWQDFEMLGQTTLKRFGLHIYDASFWMSEDKSTDYLNKNTCALSITYARNIRAQQLLSSTRKEWERLGFTGKYPIEAWLTILKNIWPDVKKGDQLVIVSTPEGKSTFYNNLKPLGTVEDSEFGAAFLAIWLDENSRFKKNRKELLGE